MELETRLYYAHSFNMLERSASEKRKREEDEGNDDEEEDEDMDTGDVEMEEEDEDVGRDGDESFISEGTEFSFEFTNAISLDLPTGQEMVSAEELFVDGKLRPLTKEGALDDDDNTSDLEAVAGLDFVKKVDGSDALAWASFNERLAMAGLGSTDQNLNQSKRRVSTIPGFRFDQASGVVGTSFDDSLAMASKHLKSFHESPRCASMTVGGSRGHNRRSCVSLNSSRCSSPSRSFAPSPGAPRAFAQPQTTPTSPKASFSSSVGGVAAAAAVCVSMASSQSNIKQSAFSSSKFLEFFKIKKHHSSNPNPNPNPNSRSFWPFSRSNSAGESKSLPVVLPPPRRSNSAGESKTSSSSLFPTIRPTSGRTPSAHYSSHHQQQQQQQLMFAKKGSFPSYLNAKHVSGALEYGDYDLFGSSTSQQTTSSSSSSRLASIASMPQNLRTPTSYRPASAISKSQPLQTGFVSHRHASVGSMSHQLTHNPGVVPRVHMNNAVARRDLSEDQHQYPEYCPPSQANRSVGSPRRQLRRGTTANVNSFNRGSPSHQVAWNGPGRSNNLGRGTVRNFDRSNNKGLVRPKDMLNRDTTSIRITPVLNVPACITPSSKSKLFNLGNIFSKKEKAARGYSMLAPTDSQSGG